VNDINTLPSASGPAFSSSPEIRIVTRFSIGTFSSDTEDGVVGSFARKVEVNMKKVSKRTVTSLIAVMSMRVLFLLIFTFPIFTFN
jgi:hypothetical protein